MTRASTQERVKSCLGFVDGLLVEVDQPVDGPLADLERRQVRQEVVADEEAHEDPVVDGALQVVREGQVGHLQLPGQILAQHVQPHEDELLLGRDRRPDLVVLAALLALAALFQHQRNVSIPPRKKKEKKTAKENGNGGATREVILETVLASGILNLSLSVSTWKPSMNRVFALKKILLDCSIVPAKKGLGETLVSAAVTRNG